MLSLLEIKEDGWCWCWNGCSTYRNASRSSYMYELSTNGVGNWKIYIIYWRLYKFNKQQREHHISIVWGIWILSWSPILLDQLYINKRVRSSTTTWYPDGSKWVVRVTEDSSTLMMFSRWITGTQTLWRRICTIKFANRWKVSNSDDKSVIM